MLEVWTTVTIGANADSFHAILKSITTTEGAHAALYDMDKGTLMTSSLQSSLVTAGSSGRPALDAAYHVISPATVTTTRINLNARSHDGKKHVVACARVVLTTGLDLAVVTSTPRERYFSEVDRLTMNLLAIGIVIALLTITLSVFIAITIHSPIRQLVVGMHLASVMKNHKVSPVQSFLKDIDLLCDAFDVMNAKLLIARDYMPQALLTSDTSESEEQDEGDDEEDEDKQGSPLRGGPLKKGDAHIAITLGSSTNVESNSSIVTSRSGGGASVGGRGVARRGRLRVGSNTKFNQHSDTASEHIDDASALSSGLASKRVTLLVVNVRDFHKRATGNSNPGMMASTSNELAASVSAITQQYKGVVDTFHGDHFVISFNAAKVNVQGPTNATRVAMDISADNLKFNFSMGCAAGRAHVGHLGTTGLRRLSIIGKVYPKAIALERICKRLAATAASSTQPLTSSLSASANIVSPLTPFELLVDSFVAVEVQHMLAAQFIGGLVDGSAPLAMLPSCADAEASDGKRHQQALDACIATAVLKYAEMAQIPANVAPQASNASPAQQGYTFADVFYGVRSTSPLGTSQANNGSKKNGGVASVPTNDEWLYEVGRMSVDDPSLAAVNALLNAYIDDLRTPQSAPAAGEQPLLSAAKARLMAGLVRFAEEAIAAEMRAKASGQGAIDGGTSIPLETRRQYALLAALSGTSSPSSNTNGGGKGNSGAAASFGQHGKEAFAYALAVAESPFTPNGALCTPSGVFHMN